MNNELIAVIGLIMLLFLLLFEYLWLYVISERQEDNKKKEKKVNANVNSMISAILFAPTESSRIKEIKALSEYAKNDSYKKDVVCNKLLELLDEKENMIEGKQQAIDILVNEVNPIEFYTNMFNSNETPKKGYACLRLAEFNATQNIEDIKSLLNKKNRRLKYVVGMSLVVLGDQEGTLKFINEIQKDRYYSFRVINEIIDRYSGDMYSLVQKIINTADEYVISSVIKAVGKFEIPELLDYIIKSTKSTSLPMKIAATKALSFYSNQKILHDLIILSRDNNSVIREYAVKGLAHFSTQKAIGAVEIAIKDDDWWVRQQAAKSIIIMDKTLSHIEDIIKGYDRYASEAVIHALYRTLDVKEDTI